MTETDREKTAFCCHRGLFEFNVMPFGLVNAPSIFSQLIAIAFQGLEKFTVAYLDDILIYSETLEVLLSHIKQVFEKLRQHDLKLKLKKCSFLKEETKYLGFVITCAGVRPDPGKVKAIKTLPAPKTVKEVRSMIGMYSYYRRFLPNFSKIT